MKHPTRFVLLTIAIVVFWLTTCNMPLATPTPPIVLESGTLAPVPTETAALNDTGWQPLDVGLEQRVERVLGADGSEIERVLMLRIDPLHYRFDVAYSPGAPKSLVEWSTETGALLTVNGGFYTAEYLATGLTIVDGSASGWNYETGGMVAIWDGTPQIRSNVNAPYDHARDSADAGLQAFPILVHPDRSGYTETAPDRARRTVIAQDDAGRILFILSTRSYFTLAEMSSFLLASDLDLRIALNLDGGTSTGLLMSEPRIEVPAFVLLPTVLTVYRR